jgi:catechol 2,3-dioxygenase-like lactoylglutathione lyase family enzyme
MPHVTGVLETCLYAEELDRAARFYEELFGWKPMFSDARLRAYGVSKGSVLLLFKKGATGEAVVTPNGVIPAHDGVPGGHLAFSIEPQEWEPWLRRLEGRGISVENTVRWPRGGQSLYFRDPEDNLVELATPGLWAVY